jgi:CHAT domain-containing protein/tetratricopeptide (TPR) repeat protein
MRRSFAHIVCVALTGLQSVPASAQLWTFKSSDQQQTPGLFDGLGKLLGRGLFAPNPANEFKELQTTQQTIHRLEAEQRFTEALDLCNQAIQTASRNPMMSANAQVFGSGQIQQFRSARIRLLVKSGQTDQAATDFRKSIDVVADSATGRMSVAVHSALMVADEYVRALGAVNALPASYDAMNYVKERLQSAAEGDATAVQHLYARLGDIAFQLGRIGEAERDYLKAWQGVNDMAAMEAKRPSGSTAMQAVFGSLPGTGASILDSLYEDFDIDRKAIYPTLPPGIADGSAAASRSEVGLPPTILKNLVITSQRLGNRERVVSLYRRDLAAFITNQERSAALLAGNRPGGSSSPTMMTSSSPDTISVFQAFGDALQSVGETGLAKDAFAQALRRSQQGLQEISTSFGSPRAAVRFHRAANEALGRLVNSVGPTTTMAERTNLSVQLGLLKGAIHDHLMLANRIPIEMGDPQLVEMQTVMQRHYDAVDSTWKEKGTFDAQSFANYGNTKFEIAKAITPKLKSAVEQRFNASSLQQVAASLPTGTVVLDIFLARTYEGGGNYWVFVHRSGHVVELINLGPAEVIDKKLAELRQDILDVNEPRVIAAANQLGELLWAPVAPLLADPLNITVSPDGALSLLPFDILRSKGAYLLERFNVQSMTSLRDLIPSPVRDKNKSEASVLLGDPDFGTASTTPESRPAIRFDPLPGTRTEILSIAERFKSGGQAPEVLLGNEASLDRILQVRSPRVLHLASHGFFIEETPTPEVHIPGADLRPGSKTESAKKSTVPSSGIALYQANVGSPSKTLLTIDKISRLDLRGTDLVVLSACETGLGKLKSGEGVRGLRASFQLAGASKIVSSLWIVPDDESATLMASFYEEYLKGMTASSALRKAKLQVFKREPNPFYWGAFVLNAALP